MPKNTYSINDHEETLKNETVEPKDSEGSDRSEITVRNEFFDMRWDKCIGYFKIQLENSFSFMTTVITNEFFDMRWDKCIGYFKFNSKIHSAS